MRAAQPPLAGTAIAALAAGNDLFCGDPVAHLERSVIIRADFCNVTEKFMAGDKRRFGIGRVAFAASEAETALLALDITRTDAAGFDFQNDIRGVGAVV